jgi:membrane-associated phospholipid phosphatase
VRRGARGLLSTVAAMRGRLTRSHAVAAALAAGAVLAFWALAQQAAQRRHLGWDALILGWVGRRESDPFEAVMVTFSFLGAGTGLLLMLSPLLFVLLRRRRVADTLFVAASLLLAQVVGRVVKDAIDKPRPPRPDREELHALVDLRQVVLVVIAAAVAIAVATRWRRPALSLAAVLVLSGLVYEIVAPAIYAPESRSFPSGHATSSMAVTASAAVLAWPTRWRWPAAWLGAGFVVVVGLSRIALGVHYPSDVLGGWCLALAAVAVVRLVICAANPAERPPRPTGTRADRRVGPRVDRPPPRAMEPTPPSPTA